MRNALLVVLVLGLLGLLGVAAADEGDDAQLAAARAKVEDYARLVNARHFDELRGLFTDDVDYRSESWIHVQGWKALTNALREAVKKDPEFRLDLEIGTAQRVSKGVVLVDGRWALLKSPEGRPLTGGMTCTLASEGEQWKIAAMRDWTDKPNQREDLFRALDWIQGAWTGESLDVPFTINASLTPGGGFLHMAMEFGGGEEKTGLSTLIGLDASTNTVRSWHFMHDGATGEGSWAVAERELEGTVRFVTTAGDIIDSVRRITLNGDGQLVLETKERKVGEKVLPPLDPVVLTRASEDKAAAASSGR